VGHLVVQALFRQREAVGGAGSSQQDQFRRKRAYAGEFAQFRQRLVVRQGA
jgi:hypothetical protein